MHTPKPHWLKVNIGAGEVYRKTSSIIEGLNTVCVSARCPNKGECFSRGTATFMILGNICTRNCAFCAVKKGKPVDVDYEEAKKVAEAAKKLELRHVVVTSVSRDDLPDGGAELFAQTITMIRTYNPHSSIEVLIPDFKGCGESLAKVISAKPDILNHNLETVPRLYSVIRPQANYNTSVEILKMAKELNPSLITKTGLILGMGEKEEEVIETIKDAHNVNCDILTIGQYLQPSLSNIPVKRYLHPREFSRLETIARKIGFKYVMSGPLVRSSYHAEMML